MTNRNHIRLCMRVRLRHKLKPNNYTESCMVYVADRWREGTCEYPGRSV
ncbi:arginase [Lacrimispora amygdalina]|uniref:Arginase n=1 Tax=Lacrimispora amygdalina TaxID=253257 RepID=A0A3E2NEL3_9FIRM|nr:arginase [Clostridium indicum]